MLNQMCVNTTRLLCGMQNESKHIAMKKATECNRSGRLITGQ